MNNEMRRANALFRVMNMKEYLFDRQNKFHPLLEKMSHLLAHSEKLDFDKIDLIIDTAYVFVFDLDANELEEDSLVVINGLDCE